MKEINAAIEALEALAEAYKHSTKGEWQKGLSTHHTVTETGYRIAEFHHADDANFCDVAHKYAPQLIAALAGLRSLRQEPEGTVIEGYEGARIIHWRDGFMPSVGTLLYCHPAPVNPCPTCEALARAVMCDNVGRA